MLFQSALVALLVSVAAALKPLEVQGNQFIEPDSGNRFQIIGVAYQPGGSSGYDPKKGKDPLSDPDTCMRDAALMQVMGINTIRVYNLDPDINHDECASIFNAAGMYMIIDVNSPLVGEAITSFEPWTSYYMEYLNHTFGVVEAFSNYPNTMLFFSGNEVISDPDTIEFVPQYIRAVTRDLKNYIKNNIERKIPVGYSAADVRDVLFDTWNYMQCAENGNEKDMSKADLFALNSYSWCGSDATFKSSTYDKLVAGFQDSAVPIFFSEYGCNTPRTRYWNEINSIYGKDMMPVFSGGIVYEWTQEKNDFGLVNIKGNTLQIMSDYNRLKEKFSKVDWKSVQSQSPSGKKPKAPSCKSSLIKESGFSKNFTLPAVPPGAQKLIDNGIKPKPSGKLVKISDWSVKMAVKDSDGKTISGLKVKPLGDDQSNWFGRNAAETGSTTSKDESSGSGSGSGSGSSKSTGSDDEKDDEEGTAAASRPLIWAAALPLVVMVFAW